jgi:hypothetical protein
MSVDVGRLFGRGISFPPRLSAEGRWEWSEGPDNIRQSIRVILLTETRERLMLPLFGAGLERYLFRPNTVPTHRLIEESIVQSLGRWEARIDVESVRVVADPEDGGAALATIRYKLIANRSREEIRLRVQLGA